MQKPDDNQPTLEELCAQVETAASVLAGDDYSSQRDVWEHDIQRSENLLWQLASRACGPGRPPADAQRCLSMIGRFRQPPLQHFVEQEYGKPAFQRLVGQIAVIEAAAAIGRDPTGTDVQKYVHAAKAALQAAGSPFDELDSSDAVISLGIDRLQGRIPGDASRASVFLLLIGQNPYDDTAARFVSELLPGKQGEPLPDPLLGSITRLDTEIMKCVRRAWEPAKAAGRAAWWIEASGPLDRVDGRSAEAAIYAVVRSVLEGVPIDSAVAISATVERGEQELMLGPVDGGGRKWQLAGRAGCDMLLLHPQTAKEARDQIREDQRAGLPELKEVATFEEAWECLTMEAVILGDYRRETQQQWLGQWSKIIDGDQVTELDQAPHPKAATSALTTDQ